MFLALSFSFMTDVPFVDMSAIALLCYVAGLRRERFSLLWAGGAASVAAYLDAERPPDAASDRLFVVLKGRRRGRPLSPGGLDQILDSARVRAGLARATCHQLRHTCLTRLREAGMALEAVQAQAGHASIESTRIYLHLADDWLASQYRRAAEAIDAQLLPGKPLPAGNPMPINTLPSLVDGDGS